MHFDKDLNLVLWTDANADCRGRVITTYIPAKHVDVIRTNLLRGIGYPYCSPMLEVTREQVAFILANPH